MTNIKLMIACHKPCDTPVASIYLPMHVGSEGKEDIPGFTRDDSGYQISAKNNMYCELTGLYWCWKNLECDYLGLVHYRRYFTLKSKGYQKKHPGIESVLTEKEIRSLLDKYTVLVPKKRKYYIETIYSHYAHTFDCNHMDVSREIIAKSYPEYLEDFDMFMKQTGGYMFNMFVMPKELADQYCAWLFDISAQLEQRIDTSSMTDFEKRYIGRVSERLFNVWLIHAIRTNVIKQSEVHEVPYMYFGKVQWSRKIRSFIEAKMFHKKYTKSF